MVSSNGRTARGVITDCISTGDALQETSGAAAFWALGAGNLTRFVGCLARGSARGGFASTYDTSDIVFEGCTSENNTERGFLLDGTRPTAISCMARGNAYAGFYIDSTAAGAYLSGCIAHSCASGADDIQFHIYGDDTLLTNCVSDAGTTTPNYAFAVRTGATGAKLLGCSARGSFGSGAWLDQVGDAKCFPIPGVTLKPTVSGSRGGNAALASALTALANLGLIVNSTS